MHRFLVALKLIALCGLAAAQGMEDSPKGTGAQTDSSPAAAAGPGALRLGVVIHSMSRTEIIQGVENKTDAIKIPPMHKFMLDRGYEDADIVDGSAVVVGYQLMRHSGRGAPRASWQAVLVPKGIAGAVPGSAVETETQDGIGALVRVRHKDRRAAGCEFKPGERGPTAIFDAFNPIGGAQTLNLDCPGLEADGWTREPSGPVGGYIWTKNPALRRYP